ncbi:MAG: hypothetical protein WC481_06735 [Candidatus Omnitrophota bacterium]
MNKAAVSLAAALLTAIAVVSNVSAAGIKTVSGQLVDIDWAGSKIVVSWLSQDDNTFHDVAINVPDNAKLRRGADEINFSELETPSDVTVKYSEDADGNAELITLSVTNPY